MISCGNWSRKRSSSVRQLWWRKARGGDNEGRHGPTEQTAAQDKFGVWNWVERHCEKRVPTQRGKPHAAPHDQCTWLRRNQGPNMCRECQTLSATSPTWMRTPRRKRTDPPTGRARRCTDAQTPMQGTEREAACCAQPTHKHLHQRPTELGPASARHRTTMRAT